MFKKYRLKAKLTQEEVAELAEISWCQVQRIETDKNDPSIQTFGKLIRILSISNRDVLKYQKKKSQEDRIKKS